MRLEVGCELAFDIAEPTPLVLMLRPRSGDSQWIIQENFTLSPDVSFSEYIDNYGNLCQRLTAPAGRLLVTDRAIVETSNSIDIEPGALFTLAQDLPDQILQFLLPSRYCESDLLGDLAHQIIKGIDSGYDQVSAIKNWVQSNIRYSYGESNASTSAQETIVRQVGVCRDFTHLGIALCRSINIPARIVVGYLYQLEPMDLHAWFEAFIAGRWYTFDATQKQPSGGRIAIGYGRDAADVAFATPFGPALLTTMLVWVKQ